jgi:hypothetical protein
MTRSPALSRGNPLSPNGFVDAQTLGKFPPVNGARATTLCSPMAGGDALDVDTRFGHHEARTSGQPTCAADTLFCKPCH